MKTLTASGDRSLEEIIEELYLTILSRYPTSEEKTSIMEYLFFTVGSNAPATAGKSPPAAGGKSPGGGRPVAGGKSAAATGGRPTTPTLPRLSAQQRRDNSIDIAWALINSIEFLYRH
jgi:hypothetical protein